MTSMNVNGISWKPQTRGEKVLLVASPTIYAGKKVHEYFEQPAEIKEGSLISKAPEWLQPETKGEKVAMYISTPGAYIGYKAGQKIRESNDPVVKGARIGAGVQIAADAGALALGGLTLANLNKTSFKDGVKNLLEGMVKTAGGKGKLAALAAFGVASATLLGAGIGKIVKNHQEKKQMQDDIATIKDQTGEILANCEE